MTRIAITLGMVLLPGIAAAHVEHASGGDFGLVHYLTDPFHVALTGAAVLLFLAVRRSMLRVQAVDRRTRRTS
jgi:hypothetical protein